MIGGGLYALLGVLLSPAPPPASAPAGPPDEVLTLVRAEEARRVEMLAVASRSVVCIYESPARDGGGSGVVVDPAGVGLTNFHVVAPLLETRRGFGGLSDGNLYPLTVLGIDPGGDIAMFKLEGRARFDCAPLGDADELHVGQWVAALGNPFLLAEDYTPTITLGTVSGLHRYQYGQGNLLEYADCIQVSTSINPGNSGGPLFDMEGRVVGIVGRASFEERGRVNVGLGYAVTVNQIRRFLPALRAGRMCEHGTLGATVELAADDVIFNAVQDLSPAQRAGIEVGDMLLAVDSHAIRTPNDYNNRIAVLPAGWPAALTVRRGGQERTVRTRLERLALRDVPLFVPDLGINHAEIRRVFEAHDDLVCGAGRRRVVRLRARAVLVRPGESASDPFELTVPMVAEAAGGPSDRPAGAPAQPVGADQVVREWLALIPPLLGYRLIDVGWELRGGDDVDGELAIVVERRVEGGVRLRWKFGLDSHALLEMTVGDEHRPEAVVWSPTPRGRSPGEWSWPVSWHRHSADGPDLELHLDNVQPILETPASLPEGQP